jgi:hypothetical protein
MPEGSDPLVERFEAAVAAIESRWQKLGLRPRKLDRRELSAYRGRSPELGWRLPAEFSDGVRRLDVIVGGGFPSVPARVAVVDRPVFLTWPHVERDGVLCLMPDHATLSVDDPYDGVVSLLDEAFRMIEASIRGELDDDFRAEFLTYWHHAEQGTARTVLSLVDPAPPSRRVSVWEGARQTVVAENDDQLRAWLRNFATGMPDSEIRLRAGVLAWLEQVPLPAQYPSSAKDVYDLAARAGAAHLLDELARETRPRTFVVLGANTDNGPALAAAAVNRRFSAGGILSSRASALPPFRKTCCSRVCSAARPPTATRSSASIPHGSTAVSWIRAFRSFKARPSPFSAADRSGPPSLWRLPGPESARSFSSTRRR